MDLKPAPFRSPVSVYEHQAQALLAGHRAADKEAIDLFHRKHPRFLDEEITWRPRDLPASEIRDAELSLEDARLAISRHYDFLDWASLVAWTEEVARDGSVFDFEFAVEAVVNGDLAALQETIGRHPSLVHARSSRVCCFDPPIHRATLLHYIAANGVEAVRQKTPPNAVETARALLQAGAEPDALADMYGANCTPMTMLVSSDHPAKAKLQVPLMELLLEFGADIEGRGTRNWGGPLITALIFGMSDAAQTLAGRGARIDLPSAAGLGRLKDATRLLTAADARERHLALSLAAQHGRLDIVRLLLDAGEPPDRYNPEHAHSHCTPLHQAVLGGHEAIVRLLVERGARLDVRDTIWRATPLGWAIYGGGKAQAQMQACLRSLGGAE
jgi:ankyrin repeat protein